MKTDPQVLDVLRVLSRYLRENPLACDTTEGIARWWLKEKKRVNLSSIDEALSVMRELNAVEELRAADGRVRYRRTALRPDVDDTLDKLATGELPLKTRVDEDRH